MVTVHLNTRGRERNRDYQFLGSPPASAWWRAYADHTTFEHPTVLVESDGGTWRAYVSGIPSRRRDAVGTVIRYTLVLAGSTGDPGAEPLLALVGNWLADQDRGRAGGAVSAALDSALPEADVERLIGLADEGDGAGVDAEVGRRVHAALRELGPVASTTPVPLLAADAAEPEDPPDMTGDWLADVDQPYARSQFVDRVGSLVAGGTGRALVLNLVGSPGDLAGLRAAGRSLAVLAPDLPDPDAVTDLNRAQHPKKAEPPPRTSSPVSARPSPARTTSLRLILVPIALVVALILALLSPILAFR